MWRDSALVPRFLIFDVRLGIFLVAFLMHISWITGVLLAGAAVAFTVIERWGFTLPAALRAVRAAAGMVLSPVRHSIPSWRKRRVIDHG